MKKSIKTVLVSLVISITAMFATVQTFALNTVPMDIKDAAKNVATDVRNQAIDIVKVVAPALSVIIAIVFLVLLGKTLMQNRQHGGGASWGPVIGAGAALIIVGGASAYLTLLI